MDAEYARALGDLCTTLFVESVVVILIVLYVVSRRRA